MLLENYLKDGAGYQARAVLAFIQGQGNIELSWNKEFKCYDAQFQIGRWENGREQGYVISLRNEDRDQLNIAFFEHRNSDSIHALKWKQLSINSLNIDTAKFQNNYMNDKYDTNFRVDYGEISEMAEWIHECFVDHWLKGRKNKKEEK